MAGYGGQTIALDYQPMQIDVPGALARAYELRQMQIKNAMATNQLQALQDFYQGTGPAAAPSVGSAPPPAAPSLGAPSDMNGNPNVNAAYGIGASAYPGGSPTGKGFPGAGAPVNQLAAAAGAPQQGGGLAAAGGAGGAPGPAPMLARSYAQPSAQALQRLSIWAPEVATAYANIGKTVTDTEATSQALRTSIAFRLVNGATDQGTWTQALQQAVELGIVPAEFAQAHGQFNALQRQAMLDMLGGADNHFKMAGIYAERGAMQDAQGNLVPIPGMATTAAAQAGAIKGAEAAATYPYDVGKALASQAGRPVAVGPDQAVTTGLEAMPPSLRGYVTNPGGAPTPGPGPGTPAPGGAPAAGVSAAPGGSTVAPPYNNPGGIKAPTGGFRQYPDLASGIEGVVTNLTDYGKAGINTVAGVVNRWAPPAENDTAAYIADVSRQTGFAPDQKLDMADPRVVTALTGAIIRHEQGLPGARAGQPPAQVAQTPLPPPAGPTAAPAGAGGPGVPQAAFPPADYAPGSLAQPPGALAPYTPGLERDPQTGTLYNRLNSASKSVVDASQERYKQDAKNFDAAQNLQGNLVLAQHAADDLNKAGWSTTGTGASSRIALAKAWNTGVSVLGADPKTFGLDPDKVANFESLNKTATRMGYELAKTLGSREAQMIVQQAISAVPNPENSPLGFRLVANSLREAAQRQIDFYNFEQAYARDNKGVLVGADTAFNRQYPAQMYAEKAIADAKAPPAGIPPDAQIAPDGNWYTPDPNRAGKYLRWDMP